MMLKCADWFNKIEVLNSSGKQVKAGEVGEVHVTAINNYSCALIRVAMGDTARWYPIRTQSHTDSTN
jgi:plastocyanin